MRIALGKVTEIDASNYTYVVEMPSGEAIRVYANLDLEVQEGDTVMVFGKTIKDGEEIALAEDAIFKIDESLVNVGHKVFEKSAEIYYPLAGAYKDRTREETEELMDEHLDDEEEEKTDVDEEELKGGEDDA